MKSSEGIGGSAQRRLTVWRLGLAVYAGALRRSPLAFLTALFWRLRGYRVRARRQLAGLLGEAPRAYEYWLARQRQSQAVGGDTSVITPIIDCSASGDELERTLLSLARAGAVADPIVLTSDGPMTLADQLAGREWLCILRCGDEVAPGALLTYAQAIAAAGDATLIYSDDDLIEDDGRRHTPHLKPRWSSELFAHHDFVTHACVLRLGRKTLVGMPAGNWAAAVTRAALAAGPAPVHLPAVLHHRQSRPGPRLPDPTPPVLADPPLVSIIIPTRDGLAMLQACLAGVAHTDYPRLETLIVDNGSEQPATLRFLDEVQCEGVRVLREPGPFNFSTLNNVAARAATGDLLCLLNNDVEVLEPSWLQFLVAQALRPELGAVGARLLYPDGTLQHAGVVIGMGNAAGHAHRSQKPDDPGYFERVRLPQPVSAVTAACIVVVRDKYLAVGGMDEGAFPVAFNDVDLCLRLNARGWQTFYEPRATLIHHESKSRGLDLTPVKRARFERELAALKARWKTDLETDPFHHPALSRDSEAFVLDLERR